MDADIRIRNATAADEAFLLALVPRFVAFGLPHWRIAEAVQARTAQSLQAALTLLPTTSALLIAEDEAGEPLGFIHLTTRSDYFTAEAYGYVSEIAVAAEGEGRGIGRGLMAAAERWARRNGLERLVLDVFAGNRRARRFYGQIGFQEDVVRCVKEL